MDLQEERYTLLKLWRVRHNLELDCHRESLNDIITNEVAHLKSVIIISQKDGVIIGIVPVRWGHEKEADEWMKSLLTGKTNYRLTHLLDAGSMYKALRAVNLG